MIRAALAAWTDRVRSRRTDPARRPLPEITTVTGPTLRGWVLRLALLVLTPALVLTAASRTPGLAPALLATVVVLGTGLLVLRPTPATAGGVVVLAAVLLWGLEPGPFDPWALLVALQSYLLTRLTWWAGHVPARGRVEIAALLTGWRRDVVVLAATAALGALALLASGTTLPGAVLLAALAVAGTAALALATGRTSRDDGSSEPEA
ncbi:hypothetical protein ACIG47_07870 [Promicromonospora sp. NPDC052451]|uniref:hypothetical protein n=1 Tax=Promicromonospora sp. NPDC052451 TaxID=3364407 RepID=UPI0037C6D1A4